MLEYMLDIYIKHNIVPYLKIHRKISKKDVPLYPLILRWSCFFVMYHQTREHRQ